jgi:ubiquinone/menaquinone biosynthesis C-methylase UbiE
MILLGRRNRPEDPEMPKPEFIARQSAHPTGLFGHVVARVMAFDTAAVNRRVLDLLEPKPGERILELGCGHGRALRRVAEAVAPACAVGVDPSPVMCGVARRHNRRAIAAGHARVERGDSRHIPEPDAHFDKAFSVHTLYFWPDLLQGLRELRRVLRADGELLLAFHSAENPEAAARLPATVYALRTDTEMSEGLRRAGFADVNLSIEPDGLRLARARAGEDA